MNLTDIIPLPFKALLLLQLSTFLWYALIYISSNWLRLNVVQLINLSYTPQSYLDQEGRNREHSTGEWHSVSQVGHSENATLMSGVMSNLKVITLFNLAGLFIYKVLQKYEVPYNAQDGIALVCIAHTFYTLFYRWSSTHGQVRIFTTLKRIALGGIASKEMRSNDILLSDSLLSLSRVFNDLVRYLFFGEYEFEVIVLIIPILIRLKQCWFEYRLTQNKSHLFNFVKYLTNLGPILLPIAKIDSTTVFVVLALINSSYSFIWDLYMDWGLTFRRGRITNRKSAAPYYALILINFTLRFLWVFRIGQASPYLAFTGVFLYGGDFQSFGYSVLQILELIRRWNWCFLKLENDSLKAVIDIEMQRMA